MAAAATAGPIAMAHFLEELAAEHRRADINQSTPTKELDGASDKILMAGGSPRIEKPPPSRNSTRLSPKPTESQATDPPRALSRARTAKELQVIVSQKEVELERLNKEREALQERGRLAKEKVRRLSQTTLDPSLILEADKGASPDETREAVSV